MAASSIPHDLYPSEDDLLYEEEILRNPFTLKLWWRYLAARRDAPFRKRKILYERAVKALPGSYKLWHAYLRERMELVRDFPINHEQYVDLNNTFERALVTMHKMPRIWTMYLETLTNQKLITRSRRTFDRAMRSLPVTQHERLWEPYLKFVSQTGIPIETSLRVYRRYLKFDPAHIEEFIEFLISAQRWQEAAERLAEVLNDEGFQSIKGKTRHQLWLELCDLLTKHANEVSGLKVDAIIRGGIRKFTDEVGRLWTSLADYYIRRGLFEKARDIYEEGMTTVITVRDFCMIFDAYGQFEESMLSAKLETLDADTDEGELTEIERKSENSDNIKEDMSVRSQRRESFTELDLKELPYFWLNDTNDTNLRMARLERLMERRPELVSSVLLRQNPHNVHEWHKRVKLFHENPARQLVTYAEAVRTVDPFKAVGKPHTLWIAFAHLYEKHNQIQNAREIFNKAVQVNYKTVDDLATVWCERAEMEIRHKKFKEALKLLEQATTEPSVAVRRQIQAEGDEPVQLKLYRSLKVWSFYVDLVESLGSLESTRAIYERIIDLRIATPQMIINFALLLEDHKYFEDAFKVYERGVQIFKYPHVYDIWTTYLTKFVKRYGGKKLERARDLFEQAVEKAPAEVVKPLYLQYAKLEEDYGLATRAMAVYSRAAKAVPDNEKMAIYEIYISRAAEFHGVPKTRCIYEEAIESGLPDKDVKSMCMKYAELERNLGEIDRARAVYIHASQMADPRSDTEFWQKWNEFEIQHGNEETFREMLRIKRSVFASYSQTHFILPEYLMQKDQPKGPEEAVDGSIKRIGALEDEMAALERQIAPAEVASLPSKQGTRAVGFVSAGVESQGMVSHPVDVKNPDEIELAEEESDAEEEKMEVTQKQVPDAVYGELAETAKKLMKSEDEGKQRSRETEEPLGALERFKRQRKQ